MIPRLASRATFADNAAMPGRTETRPGPIAAAVDALLPARLPSPAATAAANDWQADAADDYCQCCGATLGPGITTDTGCPFCVDRRVPWDRITRLGAYHEPLRSWVLAMKFARHWAWADWFGERLADSLVELRSVGAAGDASRIVVPVPLHWRRRWHRGFDQAVMIARSVARRRRWPLAKLLRRTRHTHEQAGIDAHAARRQNVAGAFGIARVDLGGAHVLLVDDVTTTGATAEQCVRLLRAAGAGRVDLAVAAVADRHGADFTAT